MAGHSGRTPPLCLPWAGTFHKHSLKDSLIDKWIPFHLPQILGYTFFLDITAVSDVLERAFQHPPVLPTTRNRGYTTHWILDYLSCQLRNKLHPTRGAPIPRRRLHRTHSSLCRCSSKEMARGSKRGSSTPRGGRRGRGRGGQQRGGRQNTTPASARESYFSYTHGKLTDTRRYAPHGDQY